MADDDAPPPDYHEAPYIMQRPDGSQETRVLRTDRPVTHGELSDYVASQGGVYMGPPPPSSTTTTTTSAPPTTTTQWQPPPSLPPDASDADRARYAWTVGTGPPEAAPPPAPSPAPPPAVPGARPPSLMQAFGGYDPTSGGGAYAAQALAPPALPEVPGGIEGVRGVMAPQRTLMSQAPSIIAATVGGRLASSAATPLGPEVAIPAGMVGAGVFGGLGEGGQILYEKATGAEPAEPGGVWPRIENAVIRSGTFEGLTAPLRALPVAVASSARPAADAMQELEPVLTGRATGPLADWWAKWSARPAADMAQEWARLGKTGEQAALAGDRLPYIQTLMDTVAKGAGPISKGESVAYGTTLAGVPGAVLSGHPGAALTALYPAARAFVREATPTAMSAIARGAPDSPWLLSLPRGAQVAGTLISPVVRGSAQTFGAQRWGDAATMFPPKP